LSRRDYSLNQALTSDEMSMRENLTHFSFSLLLTFYTSESNLLQMIYRRRC